MPRTTAPTLIVMSATRPTDSKKSPDRAAKPPLTTRFFQAIAGAPAVRELPRRRRSGTGHPGGQLRSTGSEPVAAAGQRERCPSRFGLVQLLGAGLSVSPIDADGVARAEAAPLGRDALPEGGITPRPATRRGATASVTWPREGTAFPSEPYEIALALKRHDVTKVAEGGHSQADRQCASLQKRAHAMRAACDPGSGPPRSSSPQDIRDSARQGVRRTGASHSGMP